MMRLSGHRPALRAALALAVVAALALAVVAALAGPAHGAVSAATQTRTRTVPRTLAATASLGALSGPSRVVRPDFPVAGDVRVVALNTTDGPGRPVAAAPEVTASTAGPAIVTRAGWGADESYRFDAGGHEIWHPTFFHLQKMIVHHTDGSNSSTNWAADVRAIYYYHAVTRGYGDIAYNYLIDPLGRLYKGRWSGPAGSRNQSLDTPTAEDARAWSVKAAHAYGANSGTIGVALLGTFSAVSPTAAARAELAALFAWKSWRHGIDPTAWSTYTNPESGDQWFTANIGGHRDYVATDCPGDVLYGQLPAIRGAVAAALEDWSGPPGAPMLSARRATGGVRLAWTAPVADGGNPITEYRVYRGTSTGQESLLATVSGATLTHFDTATERFHRYVYEVAAVTVAGEGPPSEEVSARAG